jgi:hypothetical protein
MIWASKIVFAPVFSLHISENQHCILLYMKVVAFIYKYEHCLYQFSISHVWELSLHDLLYMKVFAFFLQIKQLDKLGIH